MSTEVPYSRIDALVRLLGDEDPKIFSVAWDQLEKIGEPALAVLEKAKCEAKDERVRVESSRFLKEWSRREVLRRWVAFCHRGEIELEQGALLVAESEYPDVDMLAYRRILDGYARDLRGRVATARTTDEVVKSISTFLAGEVGLRGNAVEYYNPENSYLNRVLDLKQGIPISLATVFLLTARRLSVPVAGVGMPQHFLLKYQGLKQEVFVDVFHGGKLLTVRDCARLLAEAQIAFHPDHLRTVSDREILTRMLGNLLRIYHSVDDRRRYDRVSAMLKLLG